MLLGDCFRSVDVVPPVILVDWSYGINRNSQVRVVSWTGEEEEETIRGSVRMSEVCTVHDSWMMLRDFVSDLSCFNFKL
jgi:hypothetical protein